MARRNTRKGDTPGRQLARRAALVVGVLAGGFFLIEGGEWGTIDLVKQRKDFATLQRDVQQLERDVDSLRAEYKAVTTDKARIERIAREQFGMVRGSKELLYWFRETDSLSVDAGADSARADDRPRG